MSKLFSKKQIKEFLYINLGVLLMAGAYVILLDANNVVIGGVGGIATILKYVFSTQAITLFGFDFNSSFFILILNMLLLVFALIFISKSFFIKTIYASIVYPLFAFLWELVYKYGFSKTLPNVAKIAETLSTTYDHATINVITAGAYLLIIVFGAIISSIGLGLALRNGASTGGVDIIQQIFLKYFKMPFSVSLVFIDGLVVLAAAIIFQDVYTALYGAMFIAISGFVVDAIVFSGFNARAVNIVTTKPEEIKQEIFKVLERGVTLVSGMGGYTNQPKTIVICVMSNSEFYRMKERIREIDCKSFLYVTRASEVHGEGFSPEIPLTEVPYDKQ